MTCRLRLAIGSASKLQQCDTPQHASRYYNYNYNYNNNNNNNNNYYYYYYYYY